MSELLLISWIAKIVLPMQIQVRSNLMEIEEIQNILEIGISTKRVFLSVIQF